MSLLIKASLLAAQAHRGQVRKGDRGIPYFTHLASVAQRVASLPGATEEMVAVAFLHDILEDTDFTYPDLVREFPSPIPEYVQLLTQVRKTPGVNRAGREKINCERLAQAPVEVRRIKLCDRIDNLQEPGNLTPDFLLVFLEESKRLAEALRGSDAALEAELQAAIASAEAFASTVV